MYKHARISHILRTDPRAVANLFKAIDDFERKESILKNMWNQLESIGQKSDKKTANKESLKVLQDHFPQAAFLKRIRFAQVQKKKTAKFEGHILHILVAQASEAELHAMKKALGQNCSYSRSAQNPDGITFFRKAA